MIRHVFIVKKRMGETGNEMFAADQLPRFSFLSRSRSSLAPFSLIVVKKTRDFSIPEDSPISEPGTG